MSEAPTQTPPSRAPDSQRTVSLAIIIGLSVVLLSLIVASIVTKDWSATGGLIGTGLGALATALNPPTGIANALRSAAKPEGN